MIPIYSSRRKNSSDSQVFRDNLCKRQFVRDAEFSGTTDPCIIGNTISISCQDLTVAALASHSKTVENNSVARENLEIACNMRAMYNNKTSTDN